MPKELGAPEQRERVVEKFRSSHGPEEIQRLGDKIGRLLFGEYPVTFVPLNPSF